MKTFILSLFIGIMAAASASFVSAQTQVEYKLVATRKTSTAEKEINEAARQGFKFAGVSGGETAFGGNEVVVIMERRGNAPEQYKYRLLATSKTSTMQKELQQAADAGFIYSNQAVFETSFGGREVVVILERDLNSAIGKYEYKLLATSKTSTMQKEISEAGRSGYQFVGLTVAETAFGGREVVAILRREL